MRPRWLILSLLVCSVILITGCVSPNGPPGNGNYTEPQLKYRLLDHYGENTFFFCDPDFYPIAHEDELQKALEYFPLIQNNTDTFSAITRRKGMQPPFSNDTKLTIYREYKKLRAIPFEPEGSTSFTYSMQLGVEGEGLRVSGIVYRDGTIRELRTDPAILTCPICLAEDTWIDAPDGPVRVCELKEGMMVWTPDRDGVRVAVMVRQAARTPAPPLHHVVSLTLSDGRSVRASAGHPTADGRTLGGIRVGDTVDGSVVIGAESVPYDGPYVYDILPAGDSGCYWANGILLKSTLDN